MSCCNNDSIPFSAFPSEVSSTPQGPGPFSLQASSISSKAAHQVGRSVLVSASKQGLNSSSCVHTTEFDSISESDILYKFGLDDAVQSHATMIANIWPQPSTVLFNQYPEFASVYSTIKDTNLPNYLGAKIRVPSCLNIQQWRVVLSDYHDRDLCDLLDYGWPVGYLKDTPPSAVRSNHPSAEAGARHIQDFINKEKSFNAILGPFQHQPFDPWTRLSPLMTRPKKDSDERRVIVDLSFPDGEDVNSGINIDSYFGTSIRYNLPSITDLVTSLQNLGSAAFIWKADLSRAYRQFRLDPLDVPLMGFSFKNQFYLDLCPPFGCRSSSAACQRTSNALTYLMSLAGFPTLAYLDDFAGAHSTFDHASQAYDHFKNITTSLGLQLAEAKCHPPAQQIEWLGFSVDTVEMSIAIPQRKLDQVIEECKKWSTRKRASKSMIQSLAGKLIHLSACVSQGRKFTARILNTLRAMGNKSWTTIDPEFMKDVHWFLTYASEANGKSIYTTDRPVYYIESDSSLQGGGAVAQGLCYSWTYSDQHKETFSTIHQLEAVNSVVAYKTFAHCFPHGNAHIILHTDNEASAHALQSGRTKDLIFSACARELWLLAAKHDHHLTIQHKMGRDIPISDALSRMSFDTAKRDYVQDILSKNLLVLVSPNITNCQFFTPSL